MELPKVNFPLATDISMMQHLLSLCVRLCPVKVFFPNSWVYELQYFGVRKDVKT